MDIEKLSLKELRELRTKVDRAINSFEDRRRREALTAAIELAKSHGFELSELIGNKVKKVVAAKYAHPENASITWSGRGRRPKWVVDALEQGKQIEDLAI